MLEILGRLLFLCGLVVGFFVLCCFLVAFFFRVKDFLTRRHRFVQSFVTQDTVTRGLKDMAGGLKVLFDQQASTQTSAASYHAREKADDFLRKSIATEKRKFWENVKLAKGFGFQVPTTLEEALEGKTPSET